MFDLVSTGPRIAPMSAAAIDKVRHIEDVSLAALPQLVLDTRHSLHAGLYARTVHLPAGVLMTGALVRIPTLLIVQGEAVVYVGDDAPMHLHGYTVIEAAAHRKQAFVARSEVWLTMVFATEAKTVDDAEREFTDEFARLQTRRGDR
jgi:hypothetical protein